MVTTLAPQVPQIKTQMQESLLTPRFYVTDFQAAAQMDLSAQQEELEAMLTEMKTDYNRSHFVRTPEYDQALKELEPETRQAFVDYLERSCVSEFSGFLLFKELSRRTKSENPLLSEIFHLMARDEARHAGFLNKAMADYNITLDLGKLTKNRAYTFFPLAWVIYTVYLSEKIGYWRYIIIFRHLEKHPENQFSPLFNYFESWCQDENRHGDIFKALLRSQKSLWGTWQARWQSRFFLLSVFATHTLTVHERVNFYGALGLDATAFDQEVIRKTNETSGRAFPVILDVEHPEFFPRLQACSQANLEMGQIEKSAAPAWLKTWRKLPSMFSIVGHLWRLFWLKPIAAEERRGVAL